MSLQIFKQRMFHAALSVLMLDSLHKQIQIQTKLPCTHAHTPLFASPAHTGHSCHKFFFVFVFYFLSSLAGGLVMVELAVADSLLSHHHQTPEGWRNHNVGRANTHAHTQIITKTICRGPALMWVTGRPVHPSRVSHLEHY